MRRRIIVVLSLLLIVGALAGCGQKGDLFLPTRPATNTPAPATTAAQPAVARPAVGQR